jgi:hypothetical protein
MSIASTSPRPARIAPISKTAGATRTPSPGTGFRSARSDHNRWVSTAASPAAAPVFSQRLWRVTPENDSANLRPSAGSSRLTVSTRKKSGGSAAPAADWSGALRSAAEGMLQADARVDALIAAVARGRTFSPGELIALQATVFRYSQTVEIISRAADRVIGSIKQVLGTQV